jgi:hypothetical protein
MNYQRAISIITVAAITVAQLTGCSIIGYTTGAIYDYKNAEEWYTPHSPVEQLTKKSKIEVFMLDGTIQRGRYGGIVYTDDMDDTAMLNVYTNNNSVMLPMDSIGNVIEIRRKSNDKGRASGLGIGLLIDLIVLTYFGSQASSMNGFK